MHTSPPDEEEGPWYADEGQFDPRFNAWLSPQVARAADHEEEEELSEQSEGISMGEAIAQSWSGLGWSSIDGASATPPPAPAWPNVGSAAPAWWVRRPATTLGMHSQSVDELSTEGFFGEPNPNAHLTLDDLVHNDHPQSPRPGSNAAPSAGGSACAAPFGMGPSPGHGRLGLLAHGQPNAALVAGGSACSATPFNSPNVGPSPRALDAFRRNGRHPAFASPPPIALPPSQADPFPAAVGPGLAGPAFALPRSSISMCDLPQHHAAASSAALIPRRTTSLVAFRGHGGYADATPHARGLFGPSEYQLYGGGGDVVMPWKDGIVTTTEMHRATQHVAGMPRAGVLGAHAHLRDLALMGGFATSSRSFTSFGKIQPRGGPADGLAGYLDPAADEGLPSPTGSGGGAHPVPSSRSVGGMGKGPPLSEVAPSPPVVDPGWVESGSGGGGYGGYAHVGSGSRSRDGLPLSPKSAASLPPTAPAPPAFCHWAQGFGAALGIALFATILPWELSALHPKANDMLAVIALVSCFWMFEVMPLPAASLLPMFLMPALNILDGGEVRRSELKLPRSSTVPYIAGQQTKRTKQP